MTIQYHSGVALAKKKGKDIHVVETPTGIGDLLPVATAGTAYPRQLRYRFADVVNVKDYGAVGGSAYVCIRKRTIGEGIFRLDGIGTTVYSCSNWSTAAKLRLQWTDNSHLQVLVGDEVVRQASVR